MKKPFLLPFKLFCLVILSFPSRGVCQGLDELRKQYSKYHAVVLANKLNYNITLVEGQPHIESDETEQIEFLTPDASKYLSSYGFYHSDFQQVIAYEAFTRTANDKKFKVTDFKTISSKADYVFYDDSKQTTFDFPSIDEGAIGNLHVSRINTNPFLLSPFYFGRGIPVLNSELSITFPRDMVIQYRMMGMDTSRVSVKLEKNRRTNTYIFSYKDCPAVLKYNDAPGTSWYATHVIFFIDSYRDEQGNIIHHLSNLDDLYKLSCGYLKNINLSVSPVVKNIVDSINFHTTNPEEKARNIYTWVQHHIKYVAFEQGMEGFIPRDATTVCSRRFGDCKDMASILTEMMRIAGIESYFTWIGTRDLSYRFTQTPLPLVSNHMICTIHLNGHYIFLDATDPTCIFGFPSAAIQDKEALIAINEKEYKILTVPVVDKSKNAQVDSTWLELTPEGIRGRIQQNLSGYFAMRMYGKLLFTRGDDMMQEMKEKLSRGSNKFQLDSFKMGSLSNPEKIQLTGWFYLPDYAKRLGNEWYLNLNLFKFYTDEEIDYPKRTSPIEYHFLNTNNFAILLKIPKGYKLDNLPPSRSFHNDVWGFDLKYEQKGDWVILTQQFDNNRLLLKREEFEAWNKVLENLYPNYKETLSLSKN